MEQCLFIEIDGELVGGGTVGHVVKSVTEPLCYRKLKQSVVN